MAFFNNKKADAEKKVSSEESKTELKASLDEGINSDTFTDKEKTEHIDKFSKANFLRIGEICISLDLLDEEKVKTILDIQRDKGRKFGEIAIDKDMLTKEELKKVLKIQESAKYKEERPSDSDSVNLDNIQSEFFGPLAPFIYDTEITDIDYNGKDLWITLDNGYRKKTNVNFSEEFLIQFTSKISNSVNRQFNKTHPSLEAEAKTGDNISLRISILSEDAAVTGRTINIRKTPMFSKIDIADSLKSGYFSKEMASFLLNAVKAHLNIVICGEPGTGKTELSKFISTRIPDYERVITIEDNLEWHYEAMCPDADCTAIKVYKDFNTSQAIKHCLRSGPQWLMVAEIRDIDAYDFIKGLSTGVNGITSLHTDDTHRIPERIINMTHDPSLINDVYDFIDVGVLVDRNFFEKGRAERYISQISVFDNEDNENTCTDVFNFRHKTDFKIPKRIMQKFKKFNIEDPFYDEEVFSTASSSDDGTNESYLINKDEQVIEDDEINLGF